MKLFPFLPEPFQLIRAEVGENFAIHFNNRSQFLSRKANHFVECGFVIHDVYRFVLDIVVIEPADGFVTPTTPWLDKKSNVSRFHLC